MATSRKGRVSYLQTTTDFETGEVKEEVRVSQIPKEPDFIKLYLDDLVMLNDIPKWVSGILHELLKYMNYQNEIILNAYVKKQIANRLEIVPRSVDNALSTFVKHEIFFRKDSGVYIANPYLFGKGEWNNIRKIRMSVEYKVNGKEISSEVERAIFEPVEA